MFLFFKNYDYIVRSYYNFARREFYLYDSIKKAEIVSMGSARIIIRTFNIYIFPLNHLSYPFFLSLKIILLRYISFVYPVQVLRSTRIY